ncbi:MAG: bifunctional precorrin-2 dehydrogenase/sirohydrochlorin ferrochelatase [Desulfamplus sp.]|nr:bifunctional precorrin-2 dehydrogenase/sirohydrochlorin ferrochelatase [Desulfamplus sp.]
MLLNRNHDLKYYPISLDVAGKNCLVVGGGGVGARKAVTLEKCGAEVTVVSSVFSDKFAQNINSSNSSIKRIQKNYDSNDLDSMFLVIGATNSMAVNRQISHDAKARQILCNIADFPEGSSFVLPSIVQRGALVITVSTSGNSPALAKKLRKELELQFGQEYATFLELMGNIRKKVLCLNNSQNSSPNGSKHNCQEEQALDLSHSQEANASIFRELVNSDLLEKIASGDEAGIESTLEQILGSRFKTGYLIAREFQSCKNSCCEAAYVIDHEFQSSKNHGKAASIHDGCNFLSYKDLVSGE